MYLLNTSIVILTIVSPTPCDQLFLNLSQVKMQPVVNLSLGHSIGSNLLVILARGVEPLELPECFNLICSLLGLSRKNFVDILLEI